MGSGPDHPTDSSELAKVHRSMKISEFKILSAPAFCSPSPRSTVLLRLWELPTAEVIRGFTCLDLIYELGHACFDGSGNQSISPKVFTSVGELARYTYFLKCASFFRLAHTRPCSYNTTEMIIFEGYDVLQMWRLHVVIIQPASGRLEGYVHTHIPIFPTIS